MAEIKAFKGLIYDSEKIGDLHSVMAPPYDVISAKFQDELYDRHPNNVIRLILAKTGADTDDDNRYTHAAADLEEWLENGVLKTDGKDAIYYYTQTYTTREGAVLTRKGFMSLVRVEEFGEGRIHAHEQTLSGPKADRLKLMNACKANFSSIFSLYTEPEMTINGLLDKVAAASEPMIDVLDDAGIANRVWRVDDPAVIDAVAEVMAKKTLFIADGHHRYETSMNYKSQMTEANPSHTGDEPYNYVMMYFSNMDDEGMTIGPTHRVVHSLAEADADALLTECAKYFDVEEFAFTADSSVEVRKSFVEALKKSGEGSTSIGISATAKSAYYLLKLKTDETMDSVFGDSIPEVFKSLDVTVLHALILNKILGITQEAQSKQTNIKYVKSYDEAFDAFDGTENQFVFFLNATLIEQVKSVAEAGHVMPQKSTFFYPKLLTGLVMNLHAFNAEGSKKASV
ncbi:MAG: DUF1015 domain-containing protein [Proteobacteria bacterium]|nr:DUF1015 domain-containing protein [Pseudomonadota bacterium]